MAIIKLDPLHESFARKGIQSLVSVTEHRIPTRQWSSDKTFHDATGLQLRCRGSPTMGIKILKCGSSIAAHAMLVQNVPTFSGMCGVFENSACSHAFVAERFSLVWLGTIIEVQDLTQVGTIANCLELALPRRAL